ncbi:MAG: hypothetical protein ABIQ31_17920 [Ferruginibacter sp.]
MKNYKIKKATGDIFGSLISFLPLILLGVGGFLLVQYIKKGGGILNLLKGAIGGGDGNDVSKATGDDALEQVKDIIKAKGLHANALHTAQANTIFDLFNKPLPSAILSVFVGTGLSEATSKEIYDIYNGVTYTADDALVYEQYGRRKAANRESPALGFLWDNTEGDLRQHSSHYLHDAYKTKMIALIDRALKAYLI